MNFKNFKFTKTIENLAPKFKWLMAGGMKNSVNVTDCISNIASDEKNSVQTDNEKLEKMVREGLVKEFGAGIKDSKSYELLVDAVVHNLKKKQLKTLEDIDIEELGM